MQSRSGYRHQLFCDLNTIGVAEWLESVWAISLVGYNPH